MGPSPRKEGGGEPSEQDAPRDGPGMSENWAKRSAARTAAQVH